MDIDRSDLEKNLDSLIKIILNLSKLCTIFGGICLIIYSLRINHFPRDLSVSDGMLFLLVAACYGMVYLFFLACLTSLGICFSPAIIPAFRWTFNFLNRHKKLPQKPRHDLARLNFLAIIFALFSLLIIIPLGQKNPSAYWTLPLLAIMLYVFYSLYTSAGNKLHQLK
ncbi:MAG: hypothetical protein WA071_26715 [Undibacterium umbellatum]|uniref:hypothetical protein n=1 Tax=Undibacterium umbellatum TaxID=2762300 RepID=UPI003BB572DD